MSAPAIRVEDLGKRYWLGATRRPAARCCPSSWRTRCAALRRAGRGDGATATHGAVLGAARRLARDRAGRGRRPDRAERRRQEHAAQAPGADHAADGGPHRAARPRRDAARGRDRLPPRAHRARERLPQRRDPRAAAARRSRAASTRSSSSPASSSSSTRRSSATRAACTCASASRSPRTSTPEILLVDEVLARRRRRVPAQVHEQDPRAHRRGRAHDRLRQPQPRLGRAAVRPRVPDRARRRRRGGTRVQGRRRLSQQRRSGRARRIARDPGGRTAGRASARRGSAARGCSDRRTASRRARCCSTSRSSSRRRSRCTETIEDAVLEVGITTVDGLRLVTSMSTDGGRPTVRLEPGRHELRAVLEPELLPGRVRARHRRPRARSARRSTSSSACCSSTSAPATATRRRTCGACAATCGRTRAGSISPRRPPGGSTREAADAWAPAAQRPVRRAELLPHVVPVARAAQARMASRRAQLGRATRARSTTTTARTSR